jgi:malonate transporter
MNYLPLLAPDFSLILCGYLLCRFTALNRTMWSQVEILVYYFLFPVLLFTTIARTNLDMQSLTHFLQAGLLMGFCGIAMAYVLPKLPLLGRYIDIRLHACSTQVAFRFNSYIALAISERIGGPPALVLMAVLIGVCIPIFNIASVWPMAKHGEKGFLAELIRNPLILATVLGLVFNLMGLQIPEWAAPTLQRVGASSVCLGLMTAGAGMELGRLQNAKVLGLSILMIRHFFTPVVAWILARWMDLDTLQTGVLLAFSALPTASSCYVLANRMGYDGSMVAGLVSLSTLLGAFSLWFALGVLQ